MDFELFERDVLFEERNFDKELIKNFISNKLENNGALMLNGRWGEGKSFLINEVYNELFGEGIQIFNAWEYEVFESFLAAFFRWVSDTQLEYKGKKIDISFAVNFPGVTLNISKEIENSIIIETSNVRAIVLFIKEWLNDISSVTTVKGEDANIEGLATEKVLDSKLATLIIDDLDRCEPSFAMSVLHAISWLSEIVKVIVVADESQLVHIIKNHYGDGYNAHDFLTKIFVIRHNISTVDIKSVLYQSVYNDLKIDMYSNGYNYRIDTMHLLSLFENVTTRDISRVREWIKLHNFSFAALEWRITTADATEGLYFNAYRISKYFTFLFLLDKEKYFEYIINILDFSTKSDINRLYTYMSFENSSHNVPGWKYSKESFLEFLRKNFERKQYTVTHDGTTMTCNLRYAHSEINLISDKLVPKVM